jgi:hypothetical protein
VKRCAAFMLLVMVSGLVMNPSLGMGPRSGKPQATYPTELEPTIFAVEETETFLKFTVDIGPFLIQNGRVKFADDITVAEDGKPISSAIVKYFVIPDNKVIASSVIIDRKEIVIDFVPETHRTVPKSEGKDFQLSLQNIQGVFPEQPYRVQEGTFMREYPYKICYFVLYPAQFDPVAQKTTIYESLTVQVDLAPVPSPRRTASPFVSDAEQRYGILSSNLWQKGVRVPKSKDFDALYIVGERLGAMMVPFCVHWTDRGEFRYQLLVSSETTTQEKLGPPVKNAISFEEAERILTETGATKIRSVVSDAEAVQLILAEWNRSPGIVVASEDLAHAVAPIASYLDWPLFVSTSLDKSIDEIANELDASTIIQAGVSEGTGKNAIWVSNQEEANQLLHTIHLQTGFFDRVETPEEKKLGGVLNPPTGLVKVAGYKNPDWYVILWSDYDFSSSAVAAFASYRSATQVDVTDETPAKYLRENYQDYYDPWYLALLGDGDYWETDQFYAPDPTATSSDPPWVPTDFFYECHYVDYADSDNDGEIESLSWPSSGWGPWCCVGRVMCRDDTSLQTYVQLIDDYEHGNFDPTYLESLAFFTYFCESWCSAWDVHDTLVNGFSPWWHPIYCNGCSQGCDYPYTDTNTYNEMGLGNNLFCFNTHGDGQSICVGQSPDTYMSYTDISSHTLGDPPAFIWADSCLTATLGDEINSGNICIYGTCYDDENVFPTRWLENNAIGYMGSSMIAYGGAFDTFDEELAIEIRDFPTQSLAECVGWARGTYYSIYYPCDSYEKKTILEIMFFGDPAVTLQWSEIPDLISPSNGANVSNPVNFDWNDCIGAAEYRIQVSTDPNFSSLEVNTYTSSSDYSTTLSAGPHYWRVQSSRTDRDYESPWSETWELHIIDGFSSLGTLFNTYTFFVAGDAAYCTDVLGAAKISYGLALGGVSENPEGRTETFLTPSEHDTGNLIPVGGPAVSPIADEFDSIFDITYNYNPGVSFEIFCEGESIFLDLTHCPDEDTCIVYLGVHNSRNIMLVWGFDWRGTYAGSVLIGDTATWGVYPDAHMFLLRWIDSNGDLIPQIPEIIVEVVH